MRKKIKYIDDKGEMDGIGHIIKRGELPELDALVDKLKSRKVTLELDESSVDFFKREAARRKTSYQRMIRNLVSAYARQHA